MPDGKRCGFCGEEVVLPQRLGQAGEERPGVAASYDRKTGRRFIWSGSELIHACIRDPDTEERSRQVWPGDRDEVLKLSPLPPRVSV
jgi:hypothetical protein